MRHIFRVASLAGCILLAVSLVTTANADPVADFWTTVRSGQDGELGTGDDIALGSKIRVAFLTSATIDGNGTTQSYYDEGHGDLSAASGLITGGLVTEEWRPLVSTMTDLQDTATPVNDWLTQYAAPVYNTNGQRVADSGNDMLGSPNLVASIGYDESGDDQVMSNSSLAVWTGTDRNGEPATFVKPADVSNPMVNATLGSVNSSEEGFWNEVAVIGNGKDNGNDWLASSVVARSKDVIVSEIGSDGQLSDTVKETVLVNHPIYVMSSEVTVVPEPSTVLLWLGCSGLAGLIYWRKRRRS